MMKPRIKWAACGLMAALCAHGGETVIADFEGRDYGAWKTTGEAFGPGPAQGGLPGQMSVSGYLGHGLANSFCGGDKSVGTLTSPEFTINRTFIAFLIGGGGFVDKTCVNLLVGGKVVRTATGPNTVPGGSETLALSSWEVSEFVGQAARVQIVDDATCGWGHITVDQIVQTDTPPKGTRDLVVTHSLLLFPVKAGSGKSVVTLTVDSRQEQSFDIELAAAEPDWWAPVYVDAWKGRTMSVQVKAAGAESCKALQSVRQADDLGADGLYREPLRPQFHFTSRRGWLNDPNGLVYYKGLWHLFYQYNPVASYPSAGYNMHWGHAASKDLVHWAEQPATLLPDGRGQCYSGACFIDGKNQLGLKNGPEDVIVAFYLRTGIGLCYAYSNDRGYTMSDYKGNPVLTHAGDRIDTPRPFWFEPTQRWVAPTYDFFFDDHGKEFRCVGLYSSADLKEWTYESRVEQPDGKLDELCGCVDFFELPVEGDAENKKWVMVMIDGSYIIGTFDGHTFITLAGKPASTADRVRSLVVRGNYYATMTWENAPAARRVQMTWMQGGAFPGMPFNQQMTLPSELTLHSTKEGLRLRMNPVKELSALRAKTHKWKNVVLKAGANPLSELKGDLFELEVEFEPSADSETVFDMRGIKTVYNSKTQTLSSCGTTTALEPVEGVIRLRILLDRTSVEVYGNDGRVYLPHAVVPANTNLALAATTVRGEAKANYMRVHELNSIWGKP